VVVVAPVVEVVELAPDGALVVDVDPVDDVVWAPAAAGIRARTKRDSRKRRGARGSVLMGPV
jgi:hypothetical protein